MTDWVKVEDTLPEFDTLVLGRRVSSESNKPSYEGMMCYQGDDNDGTPYWVYASDGDLAENVTHWAPLTEPAR